MFWCITNEKSNFPIVVARYKISYGIYNKITPQSAITSIHVQSICLYLSTLFPGSLDFLIGKKAPSFMSKSQERGCIFSYSMKIELRLPMQVSHITKKIKNRWVKKQKTKKSYGFIKIAINLPLEWMLTPSPHPGGWMETEPWEQGSMELSTS